MIVARTATQPDIDRAPNRDTREILVREVCMSYHVVVWFTYIVCDTGAIVSKTAPRKLAHGPENSRESAKNDDNTQQCVNIIYSCILIEYAAS